MQNKFKVEKLITNECGLTKNFNLTNAVNSLSLNNQDLI